MFSFSLCGRPGSRKRSGSVNVAGMVDDADTVHQCVCVLPCGGGGEMTSVGETAVSDRKQ